MTAVLFSVDHHIVAPMWRASSEYLDYLDYFYYPDFFIILIFFIILNDYLGSHVESKQSIR